MDGRGANIMTGLAVGMLIMAMMVAALRHPGPQAAKLLVEKPPKTPPAAATVPVPDRPMIGDWDVRNHKASMVPVLPREGTTARQNEILNEALNFAEVIRRNMRFVRLTLLHSDELLTEEDLRLFLHASVVLDSAVTIYTIEKEDTLSKALLIVQGVVSKYRDRFPDDIADKLDESVTTVSAMLLNLESVGQELSRMPGAEKAKEADARNNVIPESL